MGSNAAPARIAALAVVVGGVLVCALAGSSGLPANAVLGAVVALAAGVWLVRRPADAKTPSPTPADDSPRLAQERERRTLQAYLDQAPTPLLALLPLGQLTAVNRAARRLFHTDNVLPEGHEDLHAAIAGAPRNERRTLRLTADGLSRTYALSVAEVVAGGGAARLAALTDIESEIQAAEAAALKELLQVLSHEIMNSLTPLASLAQSASDLLAQDRPEDVALARESVAVIARRTDGLHRFVEAYRKLARLPEPAPRTVSLGDLIDEQARLFTSRWGGEGVALAAERPNPDILIRLDPDLTSQALIALLGNAAEAALTRAGRPEVRLSARATRDGATISVADNGPGVDPAIATDIFRPFVTTKPTGSGVGLSLARQAIVSQGGQLILEPSGEGATFTIAL